MSTNAMRYSLENCDYCPGFILYFVMSCGLDIFQRNSFRYVWAILTKYSQCFSDLNAFSFFYFPKECVILFLLYFSFTSRVMRYISVNHF